MVRAGRRGKDSAGQVRELLATSATVAGALPASLPEEFQRGIGTTTEKESALTTIGRVAMTYAPLPESSAASRQSGGEPQAQLFVFVRTPNEVWADLLVNILFFGVLVAVVVLTTLEILTYLASAPVPPPRIVTWLAALAAPTAIVGMAVAA
jgi:hypothetical protein